MRYRGGVHTTRLPRHAMRMRGIVSTAARRRTSRSDGDLYSCRLDRDLPPDLDDLIVGQAEEVADVDGVALHNGEEPLLPGRQAHAVLAADHGLVADVVGHIVEIDGAAQRFAGGEQFRDMRPLPEAETRLRAPVIRRDFLDGHAVAG